MSEQKKLKALILVGGFGTRLRPLTFSKPKPLVEFINKPMLVHQIEALKEVGVDEVILAVNYQSEKMQDFLNIVSEKYKIKLSLSKENEPLGTAGPIGLAKEILLKAEGEEIFVFNSDITCKFPLKEMLEFHRKHGKEGTIATTKVKDPSRFGVIVSENNKILRFVEKPKEFVGDDINAGLYVFNKKFLNRVNPVPTSIEREVFPQMASDGELYKFSLEGFWADIGQPKDFLFGTKLFLEHLNKNNKDLLQKESNIIKGNVFFGENVKVEEGAVIGPNVVLGDNVVIKKGTKIMNSVVLQNVVVSEYSFINDCIIGWKSQIGKWVRMEELCVIGEDVNIKDEVYLKNNVILPNVTIKASPKEGSVIMC
jgi:mannose-1-phosphate guanylyltransferase